MNNTVLPAEDNTLTYIPDIHENMDIAQQIVAERKQTVTYHVAMPGYKLHQVAKRTFDVVFSLCVILLIFPIVFPIVFLLIRLDSKGSIFFTQKRNGLNNSLFDCIKFRTMVKNDVADKQAAVNNDQRITRIGKFLRASSIDELPQFINVLKGDMSIVGPRPHMISDNERFELIAANYQNRHLVKPGITGLAQINGYKGHINTIQDIKARTIIDLKYVNNQSLWLDLSIIMSTVKLLFSDTLRILRKK
jgi:putative colanic acid biosysnthesis UDP-glucose lipid carrier transferase